MLCVLTEEQEDLIFDEAFHWRYEDGMSIKFVTQIVNQSLKTNYPEKTVEAVCIKLENGRKKKTLDDWFGENGW